MPASATSPYTEFKAELEQIMRHKWLISEKENRDIGFEQALNDWAENHRSEWRKCRNKSTRSKKPAAG